MRAIKKYIGPLFTLLAYLIFFLFSSASFANTPAGSACIYFFYGQGCKHCDNVKPFLSKIQSKFPTLKIVSFEVFKNKSNSKLLNQYFNAYHVDAPNGVPVIFVADKYLMGDEYIINNLESLIISNPNTACPTLK